MKERYGLVCYGRIAIEDSCDVKRQGYHIFGKYDWLIVSSSECSFLLSNRLVLQWRRWGHENFNGISPLCWVVGDCITGLWLIIDACNMVVTSVTAKLEAVRPGVSEMA